VNKHITPTQFDITRAFHRARLAGLGYTLEKALANPALRISLNRLAQALASQSQPKHLRGALND